MYFCWEIGQFAVFSWLTLFGHYSSVMKSVLFYSVSFIPFITTVWQLLHGVFFFNLLSIPALVCSEEDKLYVCVYILQEIFLLLAFAKWKEQFWYLMTDIGLLSKMAVFNRVHVRHLKSLSFKLTTNPN